MKIMIIKKYYYLVLIALSSCTSWLDVTPRDMIVEDDLFASYLGYRNSLNGIYERMAGKNLYGQETSWGFVDVVSNLYYTGTGYIGRYNNYYDVMNYKYEADGVRLIIADIWSEAYNIIANSNNLIQQIERADSSIFPLKDKEKGMILGEALGIRAFLHFDMLRLYAPAPVVDDGNVYIPYYESFPSYGEKKYTVKEVLDKVIRDLEKARELVAAFDTLTSDHYNRLSCDVTNARFTISGYDNSDDVFYAYRGYRMNYPAIVSLLARVYNYAGQHDKAFSCAQEVIELESPTEGDLLFYFTSPSDVVSDKKMIKDLIFALSSPKLYDNYEPYSKSTNNSGDACFVVKSVDAMFDDASDYRKKYLLSPVNTRYYMPNRNIMVNGNANSISSDMLPIIRLSELYYIQSEYYAVNSDWKNAALAIDEVRKGRDCKGGMMESKIQDQETFQAELLKEVKREFITEGQIFFYYKKFNQKLNTTMKQEHFVLPLPDAENVN